MDENTNVSTVDVGDWDSAIGDVPWTEDPDTDDYAVEAPVEKPEADPPKAEAQEENKPDGTATEPKEQPKDNQTFKLKYLGEEVEVTQEEAVTLAQKGKDYDRIREKYDELKTAAAKNVERDESVEALAKEMGITPDDLVESVWLSFYQSRGLDSDTAREKAAIAKEKRELAREKSVKAEADKQLQDAEAAKQAEDTRKQKEFSEFIAKRPDVKAEDISPAVWSDFKAGVPLVAAFAMHENAGLKSKLAALEKNASNAAKSTGSKASAGNKTNGNDMWSQIENDWKSD